MPQPKKSGSSARRSTARRSTSGSSAGRSPAAKKSSGGRAAGAKTSSGRAGAKKSSGRSTAAKTSSGRSTAKRSSARSTQADARREEQLRQNLAAVRDMLARGVVITGDRIQDAMDDAVRRGRMTRADAEDLVQSLVARGRKQTEELIADIEQLLGRGRGRVEGSAAETRKRTRSGMESAVGAARKAPGSDRALREVDRARRAAGLGSSFPISGYEDLTAAQVADRLGDLSKPELRNVRDHERRNANRKSVLGAVEKQLG